ncbi:hypothetical protein BURCENBC7_AP4674 [Burkholderia cenocepacia BC7]|nr:hypothetical protein BURCENK562V_C0578 [Burkholderia cenocepacia K56-2Valvano]ERI31041.1 hypothetical protein BURCENBC7_AP4674 [Burkholderia cenocepacia BC7]
MHSNAPSGVTDDDRDGARNVMVGPSVARRGPGGCSPSSKLRARCA